MKKVILGLFILMIWAGVANAAYQYLPGTISTIETLNTAMVKTNIDGVTKEAMLIIPYIKNNIPLIESVTLVSNAEEYSYTFPPGTSRFLLRPAIESTVLIAFISGGTSSDNYIPLYGWEVYGQDDIFMRELTVYFRSTTTESFNVAVESWR